VVGGALVAADTTLGEELRYHQNAMGAINGPFDAWLTLRGIKTLGVRMDRHCDNAERIAAYLEGHAKVGQVLYPGLPSHPGYEVAAKQMSRFGGMISFRAAGGEDHAVAICNRAKLFVLAESLGGVESLIEVPQAMTHQSVEDSAAAVPADLVRLSCGIEAAEDLIADLERALG
jgi:cystathionine gamma-synthase